MPKPRCKLIGTDGNAFAIIGKVSRVLRAVSPEKAKEFQSKAFECPSYNHLLCLVQEYVDVE